MEGGNGLEQHALIERAIDGEEAVRARRHVAAGVVEDASTRRPKMSARPPWPGSCWMSSRERLPIANAKEVRSRGSMYLMRRATRAKCVCVSEPCGTSGQ